jgi:hypothetical protein
MGILFSIIVIWENIFTDLEQMADTIVDMWFESFRKNSSISAKYNITHVREERNIF